MGGKSGGQIFPFMFQSFDQIHRSETDAVAAEPRPSLWGPGFEELVQQCLPGAACWCTMDVCMVHWWWWWWGPLISRRPPTACTSGAARTSCMVSQDFRSWSPNAWCWWTESPRRYSLTNQSIGIEWTSLFCLKVSEFCISGNSSFRVL